MSASLSIIAILFLAVALNLVFISRLTHRSAQDEGFAELRKELSLSVPRPSHATRQQRKPARLGAHPVALLSIPEIGLSNEVVFNGTTSGVLTKGPGHQRNTVLPGQVGQSIILGRQAAYGGPFAHLKDLKQGDKFTATTGQGIATYEVIGARRAGDRSPALEAGHGLLTLTTSDGTPYMASGVLRVDAALVSDVQSTAPLLGIGPLTAAEQPMGTQPAALLPLILWLQAVLPTSRWVRCSPGTAGDTPRPGSSSVRWACSSGSSLPTRSHSYSRI